MIGRRNYSEHLNPQVNRRKFNKRKVFSQTAPRRRTAQAWRFNWLWKKIRMQSWEIFSLLRKVSSVWVPFAKCFWWAERKWINGNLSRDCLIENSCGSSQARVCSRRRDVLCHAFNYFSLKTNANGSIFVPKSIWEHLHLNTLYKYFS